MSCRKAVRIQREYWLAPESRKELVGPNEYNGYVRLRRFPGWHCTSGAMAGACVKGRKVAGYSTYEGSALADPLRSSRVRSCGDGHRLAYGLATILSVRNMGCDGAEAVLRQGRFMEHTPIGLHARSRIGGFRCRVYEDDTPPGPSDVDEKIRWVHGARAFRYRYAV